MSTTTQFAGHRSRRIILLLTASGWRGSGVSFGKIMNFLLEAGHQVSAITSTLQVANQLMAVTAQPVTVLNLVDSSRAASRRLRQRYQALSPELVIADSPRDLRLAARAGPVPILWRYNLHSRPAPGDLWFRWLFRRVRSLVFQSQYSASRALAQTPWLRARPTRVVHNGYDMNELAPSPERALAWRAENGIEADTPLVVTVGSLTVEKALPQTLAFSAALQRLVPGLRHLLVGDGPELARLRGLAGDQVSFLGNQMPQQTADAMRAADLVTQFAPQETFSNVTAEAMALGAVVLGADSGGVAEVMGDAGVAINPDRPAAAAAIAAELLADPDRRLALGQAARHRIAEYYPLERMRNEWLNTISTVI